MTIMNINWTKLLPPFIRARFEEGGGLRDIVANTGWLFADKVIRMGVGLFVGVWVARYLGPSRFGLLNYTGAFVALFSVFATLGLDGIVVREIVRDRSSREEILGTAFFMKLSGGVATLVFSLAGISILRPADHLALWLVAITAFGTVFQAVDVVDLWFQSQVASKYTVYARNGAFLLIALVKVVLILNGAPLIAFALAGVGEIALAAAGLAVAYRSHGNRLKEWRGSLACGKRLLRDSWPLIIGGLSVMVYMKIDQVMLGGMLGDAEVGIYTAATRISEIWYVIPTVIVSSVFPAVIEAKGRDEGLYYRRLQRLFSLMTGLALLIAVPMTFLSTQMVTLLFGKNYALSGPILAVHIWASLFVFLGVAQGPWDLTENLTRLSLFRTVVGAIMNILLNLILIPRFSAIGAAVATIISQAFSTVILNALIGRTRPIFLCQLRSVLFLKYLRM